MIEFLLLWLPLGYVPSLNIDDVTEVIYDPRNHENSVYTCLEFVIHNRVDGYLDLVKLIKKIL